ncbi:glycosyltransferase family 2 protein [Psychroserpens sp. Hel_I_66]|uniref:glycosyltransferase family 2 protein n=1 Tax=Psychroserpens sp. Hel_I_66 TaxID=1250004 RepID=UPI000647AE5F|nr:glycosyltransferase family 2 protein [Psychroserpens sp. Hel_I_66]
MKVSIITATYNSAKTLEVCMSSVLNQTYNDIEYIIIDGNSNDETLSLIKAASDKYKNIKCISEPDKGIYDALNKGINKATGDILGFVHSDDYLADKTVIEDIANSFIKSNVDGVYGDLHYVSFENTDVIVRNWMSQPFKARLLNRGWMPAHPTLFLRRQVYLEKGLFNLDYKIAADYDFVLRIFKSQNYRFHYLPKVITKMRVGGASNKSLKSIINKTREDYKALKLNGLKFPAKVVLSKNLSKIPQWFKK